MRKDASETIAVDVVASVLKDFYPDSGGDGSEHVIRDSEARVLAKKIVEALAILSQTTQPTPLSQSPEAD